MSTSSDEMSAASTTGTPEHKVSSFGRARRVLAIRPFRRLWIVTGFCSSADWLTLSGLAALASILATSAAGLNFAFSSVLLANLLPGLLFAPIGGLVADRFDRRIVMAVADVARAGLLLSIVFVSTYWWVLIGGFLLQIATTMWIPAKDAALPNLLRRADQIESAAQLGLVMTYGVAVLVGGGLFTFVTGAGTIFHVPPDVLDARDFTRIAIVIAALFYLVSATTIATALPELSVRVPRSAPAEPSADEGTEQVAPATDLVVPAGVAEAAVLRQPGTGILGMLRDGVTYIRRNILVRGLLVGMMGAFAAGGIVVGSAQPYAVSLLGGQAAFGLLLLAVFTGLVIGLVGAPRLARTIPRARLFGAAIIAAGGALIPVALSPHLAVSLLAVAVVGACAGTAFLTGITIIGSEVEDSMRGRINAIYQSMLKVVVGCAVAAAPLLVTLVGSRPVTISGDTFTIDGTRPVILGSGLLAMLMGTISYKQMTGLSARERDVV